MDIKTSLSLFYFLVTIIAIFAIMHFYISPMIKKFLELRELSIKNKKYELFNNINADTVNEVLDSYVDKYINRYVLYKFIANKINYINQSDMDVMIKDITKNIMIDISELYIYYISLITAVDSQLELASWVKNKVTNKCIEFVASYNNKDS